MDPQEPDDAKIDIADDVRELAGIFLAARHADLARLDAALAAGDFDTIRAVGHAFRGSSAPFGFPEAGRIGALIEEAAARADREAVEALAEALRSSIPTMAPEAPRRP